MHKCNRLKKIKNNRTISTTFKWIIITFFPNLIYNNYFMKNSWDLIQSFVVWQIGVKGGMDPLGISEQLHRPLTNFLGENPLASPQPNIFGQIWRITRTCIRSTNSVIFLRLSTCCLNRAELPRWLPQTW